MIKKTINGIKYWGQLFLLPIYWLSFLFPRSKNIWLFGSTFGRRFADNPRYLYLYCSKNVEEIAKLNKGKKICPIWISHNKDIVKFLTEQSLEAYYYHSFKGIWYALRAKVYIYDNYSKDINFWQSGGALKVNLWHGTGNKKINYDNKFDKVRHPHNWVEKIKNFPRRLSDEKPTDYILATSDKMAKIFSSAFDVNIDHIIVDGYPRNDVIISETSIKMIYTPEEKKVVEDIKKIKNAGNKIIVYMPTFRDSETKFFDMVNLEEFNNFLIQKNYFFITKLHPKSKLRKQFEMIEYSNIKNVSPLIDTYTFLGLADMLTTDFSSIHTDFALLNRPTVLFLYDMEEYSHNTRDCYFDYDEYMPELKSYNMLDFMNNISKAFASDDCKMGRSKLVNDMWKYQDNKACERITGKIMELIAKKSR